MEKLKEIQSLAVDQMKNIKKMQVICKSLRLARYEQETPIKEGGGQCAPKERNLALYEQEKLIKESDGQCKLEDMKAMGAPQNQIISPLHNLSMQKLLNRVKDGFAAPKNLPPLWMPDHKILSNLISDPVCEKQLGMQQKYSV